MSGGALRDEDSSQERGGSKLHDGHGEWECRGDMIRRLVTRRDVKEEREVKDENERMDGGVGRLVKTRTESKEGEREWREWEGSES